MYVIKFVNKKLDKHLKIIDYFDINTLNYLKTTKLYGNIAKFILDNFNIKGCNNWVTFDNSERPYKIKCICLDGEKF